MPSWRTPRGNALLMAVIVVLVITVMGVGVVRFASREVAGANAGRRDAALAACAEAARGMLVARFNLLSGQGPKLVSPFSEELEPDGSTVVKGGHYGEDPAAHFSDLQGTYTNDSDGQSLNVQVVSLNPLTTGKSYQVNDITNRIGESVQNYRVVVHCTMGSGADARETELEYAIQYGL